MSEPLNFNDFYQFFTLLKGVFHEYWIPITWYFGCLIWVYCCIHKTSKHLQTVLLDDGSLKYPVIISCLSKIKKTENWLLLCFIGVIVLTVIYDEIGPTTGSVLLDLVFKFTFAGFSYIIPNISRCLTFKNIYKSLITLK